MGQRRYNKIKGKKHERKNLLENKVGKTSELKGGCDIGRRIFLLNTAAGLGAVLSASSLASILAGCASDQGYDGTGGTGSQTNQTGDQTNQTGDQTTQPGTENTVRFDVSTEPALANIGGVVKKSFPPHNGGKPVFIVRTGDADFVVLSSRCTHEGCEVNQTTGTQAECPCHLAQYSLTTGEQTRPPFGQGPNTGPLQKFQTTYDPQTKILTIYF